MITFGSLFAGIGGFDLGLERAGMVCKWQVEINSYCQNVLAKHWPDVTRYGDVRDVGRHNLYPVDLICGGFPCQPHSVAGKRRGATDDRNLWPEFIRVVRETKPRYVIAENVPGIVTTYIDTVLADLEGEGYTCWTFNIPAVAVDAPHRRERIWIVAHTTSQQNDSEYNRHCRLGKQSWGATATRPEATRQKNRKTSNDCSSRCCEDVADTKSQQSNGSHDNRSSRSRSLPELGDSVEETRSVSSWWPIEPELGRVAHGISNRVDRLRSLGNAVVPQVAEWIGRQIVEYHER